MFSWNLNSFHRYFGRYHQRQVYVIDNIHVKIEAIYAISSTSTGAQIMLANEDISGKTSQENCNSGFIDHFIQKINDRVITSFYNISSGHFTLYILTLNHNNAFSVNEENQIPASAVFMFHTKITIEENGIGKGLAD